MKRSTIITLGLLMAIAVSNAQASEYFYSFKNSCTSGLSSLGSHLSKFGYDCAKMANTYGQQALDSQYAKYLVWQFNTTDWRAVASKAALVSGLALIQYALYKKLSFNKEKRYNDLIQPYTTINSDKNKTHAKLVYPKSKKTEFELQVKQEDKANTITTSAMGLMGTALAAAGYWYNK